MSNKDLLTAYRAAILNRKPGDERGRHLFEDIQKVVQWRMEGSEAGWEKGKARYIGEELSLVQITITRIKARLPRPRRKR